MSRHDTFYRDIIKQSYFDGHGRVLPGNSRARNRSRSRRARAWKAPTKLGFLIDLLCRDEEEGT